LLVGIFLHHVSVYPNTAFKGALNFNFFKEETWRTKRVPNFYTACTNRAQGMQSWRTKPISIHWSADSDFRI